MKSIVRIFLIIGSSLVAGLTFSTPDAAKAQSARASDEHDDAQKAVRRGEIKSYSEIKRMIESKIGGRVVDLKLRRTNKGWQYFLRISKENGRVVAAVVDGRTGRVLTTN